MNEKQKAYEELSELTREFCEVVLYYPLGADEVDMKIASEHIRDAYACLRVDEEDED